MQAKQIGTSHYTPARSLKRGDRVIVRNTIKRIVSDPYYCSGYIYCEVDNVLGLGRGQWNFRADTEVPVVELADPS